MAAEHPLLEISFLPFFLQPKQLVMREIGDDTWPAFLPQRREEERGERVFFFGPRSSPLIFLSAFPTLASQPRLSCSLAVIGDRTSLALSSLAAAGGGAPLSQWEGGKGEEQKTGGGGRGEGRGERKKSNTTKRSSRGARGGGGGGGGGEAVFR